MNYAEPLTMENFVKDDFYFTPYYTEGEFNGWIARMECNMNNYDCWVIEIRYGGDSDGYDSPFGFMYEVKFPDECELVLANAEAIWDRYNMYLQLKKK